YGKVGAGQRGGADNSNTQYALLGLHEAKRAGAKVDAKALEEMRDFFIKTQDKAGGWGYKGAGATMTMTTAGLCNLIITGLDLAAGQQKLRPDGSADNCGVYTEVKPVEDALNWIGGKFPAGLTDDTTAPWG